MWLYLFLTTTTVIGQTPVDTLLELPAVAVTGQSVRTTTVGAATQSWSAEQLAHRPLTSAADLLSEAGVYVKSYGLGSLATSATRGAAAGHTQVLWNGLPINSPMLGVADLSLLPTAGFNAATFTRGGGGALWGSGAIGGVLNLRSETQFERGLEINTGAQAGSFGWRAFTGSVAYSGTHLASRTTFQHRSATNDFSYQPAPGVAERNQTNAALRQRLLTQQLGWRWAAGRELSLHAWYQESERQLPPLLTQTRSAAFQNDRTQRLLLHYRDYSSAVVWNAKAAVFDENILYGDPATGLMAPSHFITLLGEATGSYRSPGGRHRTLLGTTVQRTRASAQGYRDERPTDSRAAVFITHRFVGPRLAVQSSLRAEVAAGKLIPLVPSLGVTYRALPNVELAARLSRTYRLPTLNDRFWRPGGNPDLRPESGWSQEVSGRYTQVQGKYERAVRITAFNRAVHDYILWYLPGGATAWAPGNVSRVWSRGLETRATLARIGDHWDGEVQLGYDYIRSTNQVSLENPRLGAGEQLLYTPEHQATARLTAAYRGWSVYYLHQLTGPASGISDPLPAFHVGRARLSYKRAWQALNATLYLDVHNAWNKNYVVVERRPMPGRHFRLGLQLGLDSVNPNQ